MIDDYSLLKSDYSRPYRRELPTSPYSIFPSISTPTTLRIHPTGRTSVPRRIIQLDRSIIATHAVPTPKSILPLSIEPSAKLHSNLIPKGIPELVSTLFSRVNPTVCTD